jgi:hypothetical protein
MPKMIQQNRACKRLQTTGDRPMEAASIGGEQEMTTDHNTRNRALLQAGDRDGLITSNIKLVYRLVSKYRKQYVGPDPCPTAEELQAIGCFALVKAVRVMSANCEKPSAYLVSAICRRLTANAAKEHWTAGVPFGHGAVRLEAPQMDWEQGFDGLVLPLTHSGVTPHRASCGSRWSVSEPDLDLREMADQACRNDLDRMIVRMRLEGRTFAEIGPAVSRAPSIVEVRLKKIGKRMRDAADKGGYRLLYESKETCRKPWETVRMSIGDFIKSETIEAPGVASPVADFKRAYEQRSGRRVNRSVFLGGLGAAGVTLASTPRHNTLIVGRALRA